VRHATSLLLSAGEVARLRSPITAAMLRLQVEDGRKLPERERLSGQLRAVDWRLLRGQLDARDASVRADVPARLDCPDANRLRELLGDAARRLDACVSRRAAAQPPYLVGPEDFTNLAGELRDWCSDLLDRQQHPLSDRDEAVAVALDTPSGITHQDGRQAMSADQTRSTPASTAMPIVQFADPVLRRGLSVVIWLMAAAVAGIAGLAFWTNFEAILDFATHHGEQDYGWRVPLLVDTFVLVATLADLWCSATRTGQESKWQRVVLWWPKLLLVAAVTASGI
jgi:hypothetical protein